MNAGMSNVPQEYRWMSRKSVTDITLRLWKESGPEERGRSRRNVRERGVQESGQANVAVPGTLKDAAFSRSREHHRVRDITSCSVEVIEFHPRPFGLQSNQILCPLESQSPRGGRRVDGFDLEDRPTSAPLDRTV